MSDKKDIAIIVLFFIILTLLLVPYVNSLDSDKDGIDDSTDVYPYDYDNDGMPDAWEERYGLKQQDNSDASKDADNDGLTNLQEYFLGQNPIVNEQSMLGNAGNLSPGVKELETITKIVLILAGTITIIFASFKFIVSSKKKKRIKIQENKFSYQQKPIQQDFSQRYKQEKQSIQPPLSYPTRSNTYVQPQDYSQTPVQRSYNNSAQEGDYDRMYLEQPNNLKEDSFQVIERLKRELNFK